MRTPVARPVVAVRVHLTSWQTRRSPCPCCSPAIPHHLVFAGHRRVCRQRPPSRLGGMGSQGLLATPPHAGQRRLRSIETVPKSDERDFALPMAVIEVRRSHGLARPRFCLMTRCLLSRPHDQISAHSLHQRVHKSRTCPLPDTLLVVLSRRLLHAARLEGRTNESFNGFGVEGPSRGAALCTARARAWP